MLLASIQTCTGLRMHNSTDIKCIKTRGQRVTGTWNQLSESAEQTRHGDHDISLLVRGPKKETHLRNLNFEKLIFRFFNVLIGWTVPDVLADACVFGCDSELAIVDFKTGQKFLERMVERIDPQDPWILFRIGPSCLFLMAAEDNEIKLMNIERWGYRQSCWESHHNSHDSRLGGRDGCSKRHCLGSSQQWKERHLRYLPQTDVFFLVDTSDLGHVELMDPALVPEHLSFLEIQELPRPAELAKYFVWSQLGTERARGV